MQAEAYSRSLEELRPDLHINHKSASNTEVDTLSDSHMLDDPIGIPHELLTDLPPDQSSYRDSSHSEEFLTGWEALDENNQDQDYVIQSGNESEASQASQGLTQKTRTKAKFKPQVSFLFPLSKHFLD